ncbi:glycoside hydrolase family 10 protein [Candidatus Auribacterota bacterium]
MKTNFLYCTLIISFLLTACAARSVRSETTGLWVECQGSNDTLSSRKKIVSMLDDAEKNNINTVFAQIFRHDKAWFNTNRFDNKPYRKFYDKERTNLLRFLIDEAHKRKIAVHGWVNILRIGRDKKANILKKYGPEIVTKDNKGRSMYDYPDLKLPGKDNEYYMADGTGLWLEAGDPRVQKYMLDMVKEVVYQYSDIDGIHLDFIRYPYVVPFSPGSRFPKGIEYGYGAGSAKRFKKKYGMDPLKPDMVTDHMQAWDDWRRDQVTDLVKKARDLIRKKNRRIQLSAAVVCWADRAYLTAFQDWRRWLNDDLVDFICLMNYSIDPRLFNYITETGNAFKGDKKVYIGLGAYMLKNREKVFVEEIDECIGSDVDGIVLFSYDSMLKSPRQFDMVKDKFGEYKTKTGR